MRPDRNMHPAGATEPWHGRKVARRPMGGTTRGVRAQNALCPVSSLPTTSWWTDSVPS